MTKIQFKDLPDRTTPRNATNLNKLNNVSIGTSTPTLNEELWVKYKKNLLDITTITNGQALRIANGGFYDDANAYTTDYIDVSNVSKLSWNSGFDGNGAAFGCFYNESKTFINDSGFFKYYETTVPSNAKYVRITLPIETLYSTNIQSGDYTLSSINANDNGYGKLTDTVNVGVDSNNAGLWVDTKTTNLFNCDTAVNNYYITGNGTPKADNSACYSELIPLEVGQKYFTNKICSIVMYINPTQAAGELSETFQGEFTATKPYCKINVLMTDKTSFVLHKGTTDIGYVPYKYPYIKMNNNGNYEPIAYKNVYSTSEVVIGEWFGRPLYRKVINVGMPNNQIRETAHGISNIGDIIKIDGYSTDGQTYTPINTANTAVLANSIQTWADRSKVYVRSGVDLSSYTGFVILEYTKSNDTGISTLSD